MAMRSVFLTLVGVAVAGGSVYLTRDLIDAEGPSGQATASQMEMVEVIVARAEIPFAGPIESQMLTTQKWPAEFAPSNMFTSMDAVIGQDQEQPRRARRPISAGEPLLASKVSNFGERVTIVQTLGPNRRAMAISVDAVSSVGGFVTPGDKVDILLTQDSGDGMKTATLLQDIRVIGTDQDSDETRDQARVARTVTVDVTPEESQKLALAQRVGRLSLSLRTLDDDTQWPIQTTTVFDLQLETDDAPQDLRPRVRIRRGGGGVEDVQLR